MKDETSSNNTDETSPNNGRTGRPLKSAGPKVPYDEVDRILVFGEVIKGEDGSSKVVYPSTRQLGVRYGCSHSLIAQYSKKHDCMRRRRLAKARVTAKAEEKIIELRATAIAVSKDEALEIIDNYLANFGLAVSEGRVRFDNPTDFNTMLRLKEFILGGADSRQEIHAALSLEDIQARHQRMLRAAREASGMERGEIVDAELLEDSKSPVREIVGEPPAAPSEAAAEEVTGQRLLSKGVVNPAKAPINPRNAALYAATNAPTRALTTGLTGPHGANVASSGRITGRDADDELEEDDPEDGVYR